MKPTIEYLRDLFEYDRDEGALYWRTERELGYSDFHGRAA